MDDQADGSPAQPNEPARLARPGTSAPVRVACAGLAGRDLRLVDIIFRYGDGERIRFNRIPADDVGSADIVVVNPFHPDGISAMARARAAAIPTPAVNVVPAASLAKTRYTIQQERLGLELLPCLNRLIEREFDSARPGDGLFDRATTMQVSGPGPVDASLPETDDDADAGLPATASEAGTAPEPVEAAAKAPESPAVVMHHDTLLIGLNDLVTTQVEQTIALSGQLLVGCTSLADPSHAIETIRAEESKFVVLARRQQGISAFRLARRIRREFPDVVILVICEKTVLLDRLLAFLAGRVCLLSSRFGVRELTAAISKPLSQARARRRGNRQFDWGNAHSPWLNTGTGQ